MRIRLKSGCSGFNRKFVSSGLIALGNANTAERRSCTQRSPISIVSAGGGVTRQLAGAIGEDLKRSGGLMFAYVDDMHAR